MTDFDYLESIERESEAFASVLDGGRFDNRVPGCPDWALRDLGLHLARVQRFWAATVQKHADVEPERPEPSPVPDAELAEWMRASTRELVDALRGAAPETPAWTWWRDDRTAGAIARHQVQEAAVHRWDAQSAVGTPEALAEPVADDAVEEFVWIARQLREPAAITFVATDSGRSFPVTEAPPQVTASAPASDLLLFLYGRVPAKQVRIEGDRAILEAFLQPIG